MPRPSHILLSKLGLRPDMQPTPPASDDPASVEQLALETLRAVVVIEQALDRVADRAAASAPVSAEYVRKLRFELAKHTLVWLGHWPTGDVVSDDEPWDE